MPLLRETVSRSSGIGVREPPPVLLLEADLA
jgi:hypothetical protein